MRITKIAFIVETAASVNDSCDVGIYDTTGARLASKGTTAGLLNSTGAKTVTLASPLVLKPGVAVYVAHSCGAIGGTGAVLTSRSVRTSGLSDLFGATLGTVEMGYYGSSHPLPSTLGTTPTANNSAPLLAIRED
jgi:hypothetical protein